MKNFKKLSLFLSIASIFSFTVGNFHLPTALADETEESADVTFLGFELKAESSDGDVDLHVIKIQVPPDDENEIFDVIVIDPVKLEIEGETVGEIGTEDMNFEIKTGDINISDLDMTVGFELKVDEGDGEINLVEVVLDDETETGDDILDNFDSVHVEIEGETVSEIETEDVSGTEISIDDLDNLEEQGDVATITSETSSKSSSGGRGNGVKKPVNVSMASSDSVVAVAPVIGTATNIKSFTHLLQMGSNGNEVMELQKFLNKAGYNVGNIDGIFGLKTNAAVIKFQAVNGLMADGIVGDLTLALLNI